MTKDWASDKAAEVLARILNPGVTLDEAAELLAAAFRAVEATGALRGTEAMADGVRKVFAS